MFLSLSRIIQKPHRGPPDIVQLCITIPHVAATYEVTVSTTTIRFHQHNMLVWLEETPQEDNIFFDNIIIKNEQNLILEKGLQANVIREQIRR